MNLATIRDTGQREARTERDQTAVTGGSQPVAEAAWEPAGPSREEIAQKFREWMEEERPTGDGARGERGLSGARLADTTTAQAIESIPAPSAARGVLAINLPLPQIDPPGPRATTLAEVRRAAIARPSALRQLFRELRDIAPAREPARRLKAARRWLRHREHRTPPAAFRAAFRRPETPSPAEMTIIETPFRIPRYMDHPEWRPR